jgi:DNA-binding MarR family transcriptional regulator
MEVSRILDKLEAYGYVSRLSGRAETNNENQRYKKLALAMTRKELGQFTEMFEADSK